jgi:hypothetical protein
MICRPPAPVEYGKTGDGSGVGAEGRKTITGCLWL